MRHKHDEHYEIDKEAFPADAYTVTRFAGVAFHVLGWETEPDDDTEWSGYENRTGKVIAVMIGDDHMYAFYPDDVTPMAREDYCGQCGQVGCTHDGYDRETQA